jgi:hypothetical protein
VRVAFPNAKIVVLAGKSGVGLIDTGIRRRGPLRRALMGNGLPGTLRAPSSLYAQGANSRRDYNCLRRKRVMR